MYVADRDIKHQFLIALQKLGIKSAKEPADKLFVMKILRSLEIDLDGHVKAVESMQESLEKITFNVESFSSWIDTSTKTD